MFRPPPPETIRLAAGVVSYGDGTRLAAAVRSLLRQELPTGTTWSGLWLVVSPGDDETVGVAEGLAREEPLVHLLIETERRGKSAALAEVMARAQGDLLILLNGDAVAEPGAVSSLVRAAPGGRRPFAVMARPMPTTIASSLLSRTIDLLWAIHHRFHLEIINEGLGCHLSDELMLLPISLLPPMRAGVVNDGAFIAQWVASNGGTLHYAPKSLVGISVPRSWPEHIAQRRRILRGHRQITRLTGNAPTTLPRFAMRHPDRAVRLVVDEVRKGPQGRIALLALASLECWAIVLARYDELRGVDDPVRWTRVVGMPWRPTALGAPGDRVPGPRWGRGPEFRVQPLPDSGDPREALSYHRTEDPVS